MSTWWERPSWFDDAKRWHREMDRLFRGFGEPVLHRGVYPLINLYDDIEGFRVRAEVPGLDKESLDITATSDTLTIKGERRKAEPENVSYHRRERDYGTFSRSLRLPEPINPDKVNAVYRNGVLDISLPRSEEAKPRKVVVKGQ